jgi:hypothetical protein
MEAKQASIYAWHIFNILRTPLISFSLCHICMLAADKAALATLPAFHGPRSRPEERISPHAAICYCRHPAQ